MIQQEKRIIELYELIDRADRLSTLSKPEALPENYSDMRYELFENIVQIKGKDWLPSDMDEWDQVKEIVGEIKLKEPQPKDLDEVVDMIIGEIKQQPGAEDYVKKEGIAHHGAGTSIRNRLYLWWYEGHNTFPHWPKEKPALVKWFNDRNIYHADDMSGTISEAVEAKLKGEAFDFDNHIKRYFKHWKKSGFKDGIYTPGKEPTEKNTLYK